MQRGPVLYDSRRLFSPDGAHRRVLLLLREWGELSIEGVALRSRLSYHFAHAILDRGVTNRLIALRTAEGLYCLAPAGARLLESGGDHDVTDHGTQAGDPHAAAVA